MKPFILFLQLLLSVLCSIPAFVYGQSTFQVTGKTNMLTTGKAVLSKTAAKGLEGFQVNYDTVPVRDHKFHFRGIYHGVQSCRIILLDAAGKQQLTEPIFLSAGTQHVVIDSLMPPHDFLDVGFGVAVEGSPNNDEYIHQYLAAYQKSDEQVKSFLARRRAYSSIKDTAARRVSLLQAEMERLQLRKSRDSILYRYAELNPSSAIMPWILYAALVVHGYSEYYQGAFRQIAPYTEPKMRTSLEGFLAKQSLKAPKRMFPLIDLLKRNLSADISQAKYTLVEFWFSNCAPCIAQFDELKSYYQDLRKKGLEVVAISIDGKDKLAAAQKIIREHQYPWKQIADVGGEQARSINVHSFPSNFLLDKQGKIMQTNIGLESLKLIVDKD
jgi:peroxiredoxin